MYIFNTSQFCARFNYVGLISTAIHYVIFLHLQISLIIRIYTVFNIFPSSQRFFYTI